MSGLRLDLLAQNVRLFRRHLSMREAAQEIGISPATVCRIESGLYAPDLENFAKVCRWMSADPWDYLGKGKR